MTWLRNRIRSIRSFTSKLRWFASHWNEVTPGRLTAWLSSDEIYGRTLNYVSDGIAVQNNCDCLTEERFAEAYRLSLSVNDWRGSDGSLHDMRWRYYIYCKFVELAMRVAGDFVECGVYKGGYAIAAMQYTRFRNLGRTFHLLDTFDGLSAPHLSDQERAAGLSEKYRHYEKCFDWVRNTFENYPVNIIRGTVPETLVECTPEAVAFLSLDMNCTAPEVAALRYFWPRLQSGSIVLHDDYGFAAHIEQKHAIDRLADELAFSVLALPTGQAVIIKP